MPYHFFFFFEIPENSCRWRIGWISRILHGGWGSDRGQLGDEINAEVRCVCSCSVRASEISGTFKIGSGERWFCLAGRWDKGMTSLGFRGLRHRGK